MEDGAFGDAFGGEDVEGVVPGVAGVDHERQAELVGQADLLGECRALGVAGRVVVVVVEPGLADGDDLGVVEQVGDRVDAVACFVGVEPDGGPDAGVGFGCRDRGEARGPVTADGDHRGDAGLMGGVHGRVGAARHPLVVHVTVRIEVPETRHAVIRGKSGSPLVTVRPPG